MNQPHVVIFSIALSLSCVPFLEIVSVVSLLRCYTMNSRSPHATQVDPLYAFTFIRTFLNILIEYFGEVTAPVLRDNFDIVIFSSTLRGDFRCWWSPSHNSPKRAARYYSPFITHRQNTLCYRRHLTLLTHNEQCSPARSHGAS